jgi:hypothetical protein
MHHRRLLDQSFAQHAVIFSSAKREALAPHRTKERPNLSLTVVEKIVSLEGRILWEPPSNVQNANQQYQRLFADRSHAV